MPPSVTIGIAKKKQDTQQNKTKSGRRNLLREKYSGRKSTSMVHIPSTSADSDAIPRSKSIEKNKMFQITGNGS